MITERRQWINTDFRRRLIEQENVAGGEEPQVNQDSLNFPFLTGTYPGSYAMKLTLTFNENKKFETLQTPVLFFVWSPAQTSISTF